MTTAEMAATPARSASTGVAARAAGMRPGNGLVALLAGWTALAVAAAFRPALVPLWVAAGLAVAGVAAWGWRELARRPRPSVEREVAPSLPLGEASPVRLRLANPGAGALAVEVADRHPPWAEAEGLPARLALPAGGWAEVEYRLRPLRRGDARFGATELLVRSRGDLWRRRLLVGEGRPVRVLPNFRAVARYALMGVEDRLGHYGVRVLPRRGEGLEFQELREYRESDSLRRIDWKATARRQRLISREYQDERDQQVVCLVDCGRRMRARDGDLAHFDQVLNAVLLLAYVALRQGDAVGLSSFGGERRWLPPVKGAAGLPALLGRVYDLESSTEPSDFLEAASDLMARQRRRALVVLVSNLRDEDASELLPALRLLRTRHLVLTASLREAALGASLERPPRDLREALRAGSIHRYLAGRERLLKTVRDAGVLTLDVEPRQLPLALVQRYLDVKRGRML